MKVNNQILIFGNGQIAKLAEYYFRTDSDFDVVGFVADDEFVNDKKFCNLPLIKLSDLPKIYCSSQ